MNFELTDEQKALREAVATFAAREIAPYAADWDRRHHFEDALYRKLGEIGVMGMTVSEEFGGSNLDSVSVCLAIEELSKADAGVGVTVSVHAGLVARILENFATRQTRERYLPRLATGEWLGSFALTEAEAGSDASSLRAHAQSRDDHYVLNGVKQWASNAGHAKAVVVFARSGGPGAEGISAFLVDPDEDPGVSIGRETEKLGIHSSNTVDVVLENAKVPAARLLGAEGEGYKIALKSLGGGRLGIAAQAVGILAACLETARKYALDRHQFGRPIGAFQAVSFKIADMAVDLDAARLLLYRAAWMRDQGDTSIDASSKAKLFASEAARRHANECVQILGGYGYTTEFPAERYYRDAKITEIYEGTSEVQRIVIAREVLGRFDESRATDRSREAGVVPSDLNQAKTRDGASGAVDFSRPSRTEKQ